MQNTTLPSIDNFKLHAKLIKAILGKHIKLGQALTLLSQQYGYKNWQSFRPTLLSAIVNQNADKELMERTIKALDKWFEKFPNTNEDHRAMVEFGNTHLNIWESFIQAKEEREHGKVIPQKIIKYTLDEKHDDMLTIKDMKELTMAHDLMREHLEKVSPMPLLIVVSSNKTVLILKDLYSEKMHNFKQFSKETLFAQGRSMGLKVFDIVTEKESYKMPERILANCEVVEIPQLIRNAKETQRTIDLEPQSDKKFPTSPLTINIAGLSNEEIIEKLADEVLNTNKIEVDRNLPLKEILSDLRRKNIVVALQTVSTDDYYKILRKPRSKTTKVTQHLKDIPKEVLKQVQNAIKSEPKEE